MASTKIDLKYAGRPHCEPYETLYRVRGICYLIQKNYNPLHDAHAEQQTARLP